MSFEVRLQSADAEWQSWMQDAPMEVMSLESGGPKVTRFWYVLPIATAMTTAYTYVRAVQCAWPQEEMCEAAWSAGTLTVGLVATSVGVAALRAFILGSVHGRKEGWRALKAGVTQLFKPEGMIANSTVAACQYSVLFFGAIAERD